MIPLLTVFTPAYNRAYILPKLYESLLGQGVQNFEWLIVDDGSTDDTEMLVAGWIAEERLPIRYIKKHNEGKHIAINTGVAVAHRTLFFIVDSDDYLVPEATQMIARQYEKIKDRGAFAGMSFRRGHSPTEPIGSAVEFEDLELSVLDFRYRKKITGDMAEVYKTEVLRKYPFPKLGDEKFCAESLVWNRIALDYKMLWSSKITYICAYLEDGLTANTVRLRKNSPRAATLYYAEFEKMPVPFLQKIKANINFWRFAAYLPADAERKRVSPWLSLIGWPVSRLYLIKDKSE